MGCSHRRVPAWLRATALLCRKAVRGQAAEVVGRVSHGCGAVIVIGRGLRVLHERLGKYFTRGTESRLISNAGLFAAAGIDIAIVCVIRIWFCSPANKSVRSRIINLARFYFGLLV